MSKINLDNSIINFIISVCCFAFIIICLLFLYKELNNNIEGLATQPTFQLKDIITNKRKRIERLVYLLISNLKKCLIKIKNGSNS